MTTRITATLGVLGACAAASLAEPVFIATANNTMYRFTIGGNIETFTLGDKMMSLAVAPDGRILGHSAERNTGQLWESYELVGALGANPSLSMLSDQVPGPRPTLSFAGGNAYSTREASDQTTEFITVDPSTLVDSGLVGNTGLGRSTNGSGYDPGSDTLYVINGTTDSLYTINRNDGSATLVGVLGMDYFNGGAEFFGGTLYAFVQDTSRQQLVLGSIDTSNGTFTGLRVIDSYDPNDSTFIGLTVVPAPASLGLLALGGLVAARRRR